MKIIKIVDSITQYSVDKINCKEKPIINLLSLFNTEYSSLYLILIKMLESYNLNNAFDKDVYLREIFGVKVLRMSPSSDKILPIIKKHIDFGMPIIIGGDLFELFYSSNYLRIHWPHWFVVNGYDDETLLFNLFDNTHIIDDVNEDFGYKNFKLPYNIMTNMYESFLKYFSDDDYYGITLMKPNGLNFDDIKVIIKILSVFLSNININNFDYKCIEQISLLNILSNSVKNGDKIEKLNYLSELILNTNKYKKVFLEQLSIQMERFYYNKGIIEDVIRFNNLLYEQWQSYSTRSIISIRRNIGVPPFPEKLYKMECDLNNYLYNFRHFLQMHNHINENKSQSININKGHYSFILSDGKSHNWWLEDDCPKICLFSGEKFERFEIATKYLIDEQTLENRFQFGIYVNTYQNNSNINKTHFIGFDRNNKFVLDVIGECNSSSELNYKNFDNFYVRINKNNISCGVKQNQIYKEYLSSDYIDCSGKIDVGLACKTWGNGKYFHVDFFDITVSCDGIEIKSKKNKYKK